MSAAFPARVPGMASAASGTGFVWSLGEIMGRTGDDLPSRDPRGGEQVEAFDVIDLKLPLFLLSRSETDRPECF